MVTTPTRSGDLDASFVIVDSNTSSSAPSRNTTDASIHTVPSVVGSSNKPSTSGSFKNYHSYAHDWSAYSTGGSLKLRGGDIVDTYGRVCLPRGVNLGGNCKTPINDDEVPWPSGHREVSFVGRPFPLEEAPEHLSRLRRWGLTFVRFLITWEAVEHAGPGQYDTAYLSYIRSLLSMFPSYGLTAWVSLHQDVWSRYSGGSGAPAWTLEMAGFDLVALEETGSAWLKGVRGGGRDEAERGIWPCGYQKLAAATMATCFWAGDTFTPDLKIPTPQGAKPIQSFLQDAFLAMWMQVVNAVGDLPAVLGFEIMNEPHRGYVEQKSLHEFVYETDLHLSYVPSAFESFQLGAGHPTSVGHWTRSFPMPTKKTGSGILNQEGRRVWRPDGPTNGKCIWEMHSVWAWDESKNAGVVLRESYFNKNPLTGNKVDWYDDFYFPFVKKWSEMVRSIAGPEKIVLAELIPNELATEATTWTPEKRPSNMIFTPHWYDLNALFLKAFGDFSVNVQGLSRGMFPLKAFYWGHASARENFSLQLGNIVKKGGEALEDIPMIVGECGIPMDMNKGEAFRTNDFTWQARMMDAMITGLERAQVGFTLWNYNPDNTDLHGDYWNGENFSWFSRSRAARTVDLSSAPEGTIGFSQTDAALDQGARILGVVVRPYAAKIAGRPVRTSWDPLTGRFELEYTPSEHQEGKGRETEIFMPDMLARGKSIRMLGLDEARGQGWTYDPAVQTLYVAHGKSVNGEIIKVMIDLGKPDNLPFVLSSLRENGVPILSFLVAFLGVFLAGIRWL